MVTAPSAVTVPQTVCGPSGPGSSGLSNLSINNFLHTASAVDNCSSAPLALAPMVNGSPVDDTFIFPPGATTVFFSFTDESGNTGTSSSTVTVQAYGDPTGDGKIDASDLVVLANELVGNVTPGFSPFNAPSYTGDLNHDGVIDAVDLVMLANYIVGNISCLPPGIVGLKTPVPDH